MAIEACGGDCWICRRVVRAQVRAALRMVKPENREQVARDALDELNAADEQDAARD